MCETEALTLLRGTGNLYDRHSEKYPDVSKEDVYGFFFDTAIELCYLADCLKNKYSLGEMFVERTFGKLESIMSPSHYGGADIFQRADNPLWWKYFYRTSSQGNAPFPPVFVDDPPDGAARQQTDDMVRTALMMKLLEMI